jgi:hypothetical protein
MGSYVSPAEIAERAKKSAKAPSKFKSRKRRGSGKNTKKNAAKALAAWHARMETV